MALNYSVDNAITFTSINSLGNSATAVASSAAITPSTTNNVVDHIITATIASPATFTATASTVVNLFAYQSADGTTWESCSATSELIDGTDKAITLDADGNNGRFIGSILMPQTTAGSSVTHRKSFSMASVFGGVLPRKYVIVAQNQTSAALPASGHSFEYTEVYYN